MSEFLKGNFDAKQPVEKKDNNKDNHLNEEFERAAMRRLGGSIAFVTRKGFVWKGDKSDQESTGEGTGQ